MKVSKLLKKCVIHTTSAMIGGTVGVYCSDHDPMNLGDPEKQLISGIGAGVATGIFTDYVLSLTVEKIENKVGGFIEKRRMKKSVDLLDEEEIEDAEIAADLNEEEKAE